MMMITEQLLHYIDKDFENIKVRKTFTDLYIN